MARLGFGIMSASAVLVVGLSCAGCDKKEPKPEAGVSSASAAPVASAAPSASEGPLSKVPAGRVTDLPTLAEEFHAAKGLGLLSAWSKAAPLKPRKFEGMKPAEMSIAAGATLVDAAAAASDDTKPISPQVIEQAKTAVSALQPPAELMKKIETFATAVNGGAKDDRAQRREVDRFVAASLGTIQHDSSFKNDPALMNRANLALLGGYLRSLAITSKVVTAASETSTDMLSLLARKQEQAYFLDYLQNHLDPSFKSEPAVKQALDALLKIAPNVESPNPTAADAKAIAGALKAYAS